MGRGTTSKVVGYVVAAGVAAAVLASALLVFKRPALITDVGPPFDVGHLEKSSFWYRDNVMSEYLLAGAALVRLSAVAHRAQIEKAQASADAAAVEGWQAANDDARHWLEQNREALARWRVATAGQKAMKSRSTKSTSTRPCRPATMRGRSPDWLSWKPVAWRPTDTRGRHGPGIRACYGRAGIFA